MLDLEIINNYYHHHHHFGRSRAARLALQSALLAIQLANSLESTAPTSLFKVFTKVDGGDLCFLVRVEAPTGLGHLSGWNA